MSPALDPAQIERFRTIVSRRLGLSCDDGRLDQLANLLVDRMRGHGCPTVTAYMDRFRSLQWSRTEIEALAERLTVPETYFFRHSDQIRAFAEIALRDRAETGAGRMCVLSAGCASGEEPYTVAIVIRETMPELPPRRVEIIGCDINGAQLAKAEKGIYSEWSLRDTPDPIRRRYFRRRGKDSVLDDSIRTMVSFEKRNLVEDDTDFWLPHRFDIVFCRNVLMYFTPEAAQGVVAAIARALVPGGYLFLGPAETLRGLSQDFHLRHSHGAYYYQARTLDEHRPSPVAARAPPAGREEPVVLDTGTPWLDAIARASERIEALGRSAAARPPERRPDEAAVRRTRPRGLAFATELLRQERFDDAGAALRALPPETAADPDAQLLLAVVFAQKGDVAEAERICAAVLALDEMNAGAHYLMALCREHCQDYHGAWEHDQAAAYLDPGFAMPHLHMARLAKRQNDLDRARFEFGRAHTLLAREDASRLLLFGGGFNREALLRLCRAELQTAGGVP